jgi:hypothetical protein
VHTGDLVHARERDQEDEVVDDHPEGDRIEAECDPEAEDRGKEGKEGVGGFAVGVSPAVAVPRDVGVPGAVPDGEGREAARLGSEVGSPLGDDEEGAAADEPRYDDGAPPRRRPVGQRRAGGARRHQTILPTTRAASSTA